MYRAFCEGKGKVHPITGHEGLEGGVDILFPLQHKLIGFYNRDEKCLQRGTDWVFK